MKSYNFDPGNGVFTVGKFLRFLKKADIIVLGCILYCVIIACIPSYEIGWYHQVAYEDDDSNIQFRSVIGNRYEVLYDDDGNVIQPKSFVMFPYAVAKPRKFLFVDITPMPWILNKLNESNKMWREWTDIWDEHMWVDGELNDLHIEGQYIAEEDGCRFVMNARYKENGETVEIHKEYTFETKFSKETDYGPYEFNRFLEYLPEDLKQQREKEYEAILYRNRKFLEEGTVLRKHRVFFTLLFTAISLFLTYKVACYYRRYRPKYGVDFISSGSNPGAEFYYVIPSPTVDSRVFSKLKNEPAKHISEQQNEFIKGREVLREYCERHFKDTPARFEGRYIVSLRGARYKLTGYYTENGRRVDVDEDVFFDFVHYKQNAYPPEELRPYLGYGDTVKVSQNILK